MEGLPPDDSTSFPSMSPPRSRIKESACQQAHQLPPSVPTLPLSKDRLEIPLRYPISSSMYVPSGVNEVRFAPAVTKRSSSSSPSRTINRASGNGRRSRSRSPSTFRNGENGLMEILLHRPGAIDGAKLSVVGAGIKNLDIIPPRISSKFKTVYLSNNDIRDIRNITQFVNCASLSLANNFIKFLANVECLQKMEHLEKLTLEGNPITSMPYYRDYMLCLCPRLVVLDGVKVSVEERRNAKSKGRKISAILEQLRLNELRLKILQHYSKLSTCHIELGRVVVGRFRFLRGEHVADTVRTRSVPLGLVLKVTCHGGVYRWLQIGCQADFDELVQLKASRAAIIKSKHMGIANRPDSSMISWDDIISECLRIQQEQFLELIERCERETNITNNVYNVATSAERGLPTADALDIIRQVHFLTRGSVEEQELAESYAGRDVNKTRRKQGTDIRNAVDHGENIDFAGTKSQELEKCPTTVSTDLSTHEKYRSLLRRMTERVPVKESNVFDPKVSMSQLLPPQQEEPDEVRLPKDIPVDYPIEDVGYSSEEFVKGTVHGTSSRMEQSVIKSPPDENVVPPRPMDGTSSGDFLNSAVDSKSYPSIQDIRDLVHTFEDIDGFEKIALEAENSNYLDYIWDIAHIDALDEARKEDYLGPRPLPTYGAADTTQRDNRISSMKGLQSRLEELVDELASVGHVFDLSLRSHQTLRRTANELRKSMQEAGRTSSDYTTRLTKKIKDTHTNCLEASLMLEKLKDFYADIEEEEKKLMDVKTRKDLIRLDRLNAERTTEVEAETKEELLKSINQIIVTLQNIDVEVEKDPELKKALVLKRYTACNFRSVLSVAKRNAFVNLKKRIFRQKNIRQFARRMSKLKANKMKYRSFSQWLQFHCTCRNLLLLRMRVDKRISKIAFKAWLRSMDKLSVQKKAAFKWGLRRSMAAIDAFKHNVRSARLLTSENHRREILMTCFTSYRCFKAWHMYTINARNIVSTACDMTSFSSNDVASLFHMSTIFGAWQKQFAEKRSELEYLSRQVVSRHVRIVMKFGWRHWKNLYHATFYCTMNCNRKTLAVLRRNFLLNRLGILRMIRAEEYYETKSAVWGFGCFKSIVHRRRRISIAYHRVHSNTYYKTVISVWEKWKNDWCHTRRELIQDSHAIEFYLQKLLRSSLYEWKKTIEVEKALVEYDKSLDGMNCKKVVTFESDRDDDSVPDDSRSIDCNVVSDSAVDEDVGFETHANKARLKIMMRRLIAHCCQNKKLNQLKMLISDRHKTRTKSWIVRTFRSFAIRSRLDRISGALAYFNSTKDDISTEIETKRLEVNSSRHEKNQLAQSVGLLNCDLAAKQVEMDSLQLQYQELDVLINTMYSSYSHTLSEARRVQADREIMTKKHNDKMGLAEIKSRMNAENVSHEQERDRLAEEKAKLYDDMENEKKERKLLIKSRNSEGIRNKAHLTSLREQYSHDLERYHGCEKNHELLLAQRLDSEKMLQTCQDTLENASGRITVKIKSNEEELQSLEAEQDELMRREKHAKTEEDNLLAELEDLDRQIIAMKRGAEEDEFSVGVDAIKNQTIHEIDATDYLAFASAEKRLIGEGAVNAARSPTVVATPVKSTLREAQKKKSSSFNRPKVVRGKVENTNASQASKRVSPSLKRQPFVSPVSVALTSPNINDDENDMAIKAETEIANVSKRIRERLGSVLDSEV